ncbi:uncharacterized protein [Leuresthes tenuis]|uniref:uncharacterized protein n=1 Tax=Leuresthes tenuis TaxID=355514 RepID=UPI003B502F37
MENADNHEVRLQCFRLVGSRKRLNTGESSEPEQQRTCPLEPIQETPEPRRGAPTLADIDFRIQQLENRRLLLQKMQLCIKKQAQNCKGTTKEITSEDDEEQCELVAIQKELEELHGKKEEMKKNGASSKPQANRGTSSSLHSVYCWYSESLTNIFELLIFEKQETNKNLLFIKRLPAEVSTYCLLPSWNRATLQLQNQQVSSSQVCNIFS